MMTPAGALAEIERLLREGKWQRAREQGDLVWSQALHNAAQTPQAFALLLTFRGLAEAGLGQNDLAICHWQAAQGLEPLFFHADLAAYGAAGTLLESHRWGFPLTPAGEIVQPPGMPGDPDRVTPPRIVDRPQPEVPRIGRKKGTRGTVRIESFIEKTGSVSQPFVRREDLGMEPNFAASAIDALCHWRFAPAAFKGEPVRVYYSLSINFQITD